MRAIDIVDILLISILLAIGFALGFMWGSWGNDDNTPQNVFLCPPPETGCFIVGYGYGVANVHITSDECWVNIHNHLFDHAKRTENVPFGLGKEDTDDD